MIACPICRGDLEPRLKMSQSAPSEWRCGCGRTRCLYKRYEGREVRPRHIFAFRMNGFVDLCLIDGGLVAYESEGRVRRPVPEKDREAEVENAILAAMADQVLSS